MPLLYLDSSAIVKLAKPEAETDAMGQYSVGDTLWITSDLARTEVMRAVALHQPERLDDARHVLRNLVLMALDRDIYDMAGRVQPARLRSLDAIHVAAALSLGSALQALITYDKRLAEAAKLNGLAVISPGAQL